MRIWSGSDHRSEKYDLIILRIMKKRNIRRIEFYGSFPANAGHNCRKKLKAPKGWENGPRRYLIVGGTDWVRFAQHSPGFASMRVDVNCPNITSYEKSKPVPPSERMDFLKEMASVAWWGMIYCRSVSRFWMRFTNWWSIVKSDSR